MIYRHPLILILFSYVLTASAQVNNDFYKREILGIKNEWHKIILPDAFFEKTDPDLSSLRVVGIALSGDTIGVPYVMKVAKESSTVDEITCSLINQSKQGNDYFYTFDVGIDKIVNHMALEFSQKNFDWKVQLEGSQNLVEWYSIIEDYRILSIHNVETDYDFNKVVFPNSKYQYYRLNLNSAVKPTLLSARLYLTHQVDGKYKIYQSKILTSKKPTPKKSIFTVHLASKVPVSKLNIAVKNNHDYYRPLTIEYLIDSVKSEKGWIYNYETLTKGAINSYEKSEYKFNSTIAKNFKVIIDNFDNEALQIDSVFVSGYEHELAVRFDRKATYYLMYSRIGKEKPHFDIGMFADKIPMDLTPVMLGEESLIKRENAPKIKPLFQNKIWLWIVMVSIIAIIGWFSMKMIKNQ